MTDKAARDLYLSMAEVSAANPPDDRDAIVETLRDHLKALSAILYPAYRAARRQGDKAEADGIDMLLRRVELVWIALNQELIDRIDTSEEVATAAARIDAINERLTTEADRTARSTADLQKIGGILDDVATLIGWVKDHA